MLRIGSSDCLGSLIKKNISRFENLSKIPFLPQERDLFSGGCIGNSSLVKIFKNLVLAAYEGPECLRNDVRRPILNYRKKSEKKIFGNFPSKIHLSDLWVAKISGKKPHFRTCTQKHEIFFTSSDNIFIRKCVMEIIFLPGLRSTLKGHPLSL